ncbi:MAG TPA: hypothetical protein V6D20_00070 [Candidatus Obscuribacterales bacterium]
MRRIFHGVFHGQFKGRSLPQIPSIAGTAHPATTATAILKNPTTVSV